MQSLGHPASVAWLVHTLRDNYKFKFLKSLNKTPTFHRVMLALDCTRLGLRPDTWPRNNLWH